MEKAGAFVRKESLLKRCMVGPHTRVGGDISKAGKEGHKTNWDDG
jgi:hypothetical protein